MALIKIKIVEILNILRLPNFNKQFGIATYNIY